MKKQLAFLLCGTLALSMAAPSLASADASAQSVAAGAAASSSESSDDSSGSPEDSSKKEATAENMSSVLSRVKAKITVPAALTEFSYSYSASSSGSPASWYFTWNDKDYEKRLAIRCDSSANITSYNYRNGSSSPYAPQYLQSELKSAADAFLKKAAPDVAASCEYTGCSSNGIHSGTYTYQYVRVENGIQMPDNTASVSVNFETGTVTGLSVNWLYDASVPSSETRLSASEAAELIAKQVTMQLSYRSKSDDNGSEYAYLVYTPDKAYAAVNAKTGELYLTKSEWAETGEAENTSRDMSKEMMAGGADSGAVELTEEEIARLAELEKLITREEAIQAVTGHKELLIGSNLKSVTASLSNTGSKEKPGYVWNIMFEDPTADKIAVKSGTSSYAAAAVDAKTGKLLSFQAQPNDYYDSETGEWQKVTIKYTEKEAKKRLEEFLKAELPEYFEQSSFSSSGKGYIATYENNKAVYGGYSFRYNRTNESVEYPYNWLSGSVDGVTGKIYSYRYDWNEDVKFESPKNAMSAKDALKAYLALDGYGLVYEINTVNAINKKGTSEEYSYEDLYRTTKEVRLVYTTNISPAVISPFTGRQLGSDGEEYRKNDGAYTYSDISGHTAARSIRLLGDIGIGFDGGTYQPDQTITEKEFMEMLNSLIYDYTESSAAKAVSMTRETAVTQVITRLGLAPVAKLSSIYKTSFTDEESFSSGFTGYAALAQGLKITDSFGSALNPNQYLTRAEAAAILMAMLNANTTINR